MSEYDQVLPKYSDESSDERIDLDKTEVEPAFIYAEHASFNSLSLVPELMRAINENGFEHPSRVQSQCIPPALNGSDVLCQAKAGMGKTAVFVFSTLNMLDFDEDPRRIRCCVIVHTRELAYQIQAEFDRFKVHFKKSDGSPAVEVRTFCGGTPASIDKKYLRSNTPQIVIGTPGRMLQLVNEGSLDLGHVKFFILDECDKVLGPDSTDMRYDVQRIFFKTPQDRQVMMFSATLSPEVRTICKKFMRNPVEVIVDEGKQLRLGGLKQYFIELREEEKTRKLAEIFDTVDFNQVFVFVKTTQRAKALNRILVEEGFPSISLYGRMKQKDRQKNYELFLKDGQKARIMVATDLCGRGMDFKAVNVVINYDMPESSETYLHRVGRAGRFGTKGIAISFVTSDENDVNVLNDVKQKFVDDLPKLEDVSDINPSDYMGSLL